MPPLGFAYPDVASSPPLPAARRPASPHASSSPPPRKRAWASDPASDPVWLAAGMLDLPVWDAAWPALDTTAATTSSSTDGPRTPLQPLSRLANTRARRVHSKPPPAAVTDTPRPRHPTPPASSLASSLATFLDSPPLASSTTPAPNKRAKQSHDMRAAPSAGDVIQDVSVDDVLSLRQLAAAATSTGTDTAPSSNTASHHPAPPSEPVAMASVININGYLLDRDAVYAAVASDLLAHGDLAGASSSSSPWDLMGRVLSRLFKSRDQVAMRSWSSHPQAPPTHHPTSAPFESEPDASAGDVSANDEDEDDEDDDDRGTTADDTSAVELDDHAYSSFLQAIFDPNAPAPDEEDDDVDFDHAAALRPHLRAANGRLRNDPMMAHPLASPRTLASSPPPEPSEEFRSDRAVAISRREYHQLFDPAQPTSPVPSTSIAPAPAPTALAPSDLDRLVTFAPRDPNHDSAQFLFSPDQIERLRTQQQQNLQLVTQAFLLEREMRGEQGPLTHHWANQIKNLYQHQLAAQQALPPSAPSFKHIDGLDIAVALTRQNLCVPRNAHFERLLHRPARKKRRAQQQHDDQGNALPLDTPDPVPLPSHIRDVLRGMDQVFDPALLPNILPVPIKTRMLFGPHEDELMLLGLQAFGDDFGSIRAHMLPTCTVKQLAIRYKNMRSRRAAPQNPLKDYHLMQVKPITLQEEELLRKGIKYHGGKRFKLISEQYIKERPPFLLKQLWKRLCPRSCRPLPLRPPGTAALAAIDDD